MKLYTEEQVKRAIDIVDLEGEYTNLSYRKILSKLTPIELPSDEEIEEFSKIYNTDTFRDCFIGAARWSINRIKQQAEVK